MNVINSIAAMENEYCIVYTTHHKNNNWFSANKVNIKRIATQCKHSLLRYWCYFQFNVVAFLGLLINQPKVVIGFETYSILPIYLYKKLFSKIIVFIHYHEYVSLLEINNSSAYTKFLHSIEKKLFLVCNYISQTNAERLHFFLADYPFVEAFKTFIAPNFPPSSWYEFAKLNKKENKTGVVKLVHVGAISLSTMHTKEMVEWVIAQNGRYRIDFYTDNMTNDAKQFFNSLNNANVKLLMGINYFELPKVLVNYDIGLALYNGHIPNYVYNVPNKVLEYLACGLSVWYSSELVSTKIFINSLSINNCFEINFCLNIENQVRSDILYCNSVYYKLLIEPSQLSLKIINKV